MAPHGIYRAAGDDSWIAIACRDDADWQRLAPLLREAAGVDSRFALTTGRLEHRSEVDTLVTD